MTELKGQYKLTVGLEIHVELSTKTKMFCGCQNKPFNSPANSHVCPVCYGLPGALPTINQEAVRATIKLGQALKGRIAEQTFWARKSYFYPDLPKGYQISQSTQPLVREGSLTIDGLEHRLERIHLEEDAGKLSHAGQNRSLVDFNRAGVPLVEIVTYPDFSDAASAKRFCQELQRIVRHLGIAQADMEKGQLRCEANISVSTSEQSGTKVEVKNINSFRSVEKSINYEFDRHVKLLASGGKIIQETRGWDDTNSKTVSRRSKEESADYRYFPEPDLPRLNISLTTTTAQSLPEDQRNKLRALGISDQLATTLVDKNLTEPVLAVAQLKAGLTTVAANLLVELIELASFQPAEIVRLLEARDRQGWSKEMLKKIMAELGRQPTALTEILAKYEQTQDLNQLAQAVVEQNQAAVKDYQQGKPAALNFLVGQLMSKSQGRANIVEARAIIQKLLTA